MIKVTDATKAAWKSDAAHKEIEIRIPEADITLSNEDIVSESLELKEAIESSGNLSFQGCIAASLKVECFTLVDDTLEGMWIEADIIADNTQTIPLFRGYISEVTNQSHEEFTTVIRAYDALYKINNTDVTSWYNGLSFPMTVQAFRNSFFNRVGVTQVADYLTNDGITIQKTIEDKVIMGAKIIKAICQINGRFGRISRTGRFEYVHLTEAAEALYPAEDLYPDDDIYPSDENAVDNVLKAHYSAISFENYRVASIDKVQVIDKSGQIAASAGSGTNIFTLKDNPLVWGLSSANLQAVVRNLYNTVQGLWYTPSEVKCVGLPYVECGDFVLMSARLSIIRSYVLSRTLKGIQAITDSFSADGDRKLPPYVPDVKTQVNANSQAITTEANTRQSQINAEANTRQSQINAEANTRQNQINAVNVRCDSLNAKDAQIESLVATKASITDLNATNANVSNLTARAANIESLVATKASIAQLNATNATIAHVNSQLVNTN
ncbi:MAG: hypothetical protein IIY21_15855, partial [Clostridiales bacterium]|nr:hypothetical protein [Clostridiales bacterium]MBQ1572637.1 hypothetical protein [Clostridiales bacterium]